MSIEPLIARSSSSVCFASSFLPASAQQFDERRQRQHFVLAILHMAAGRFDRLVLLARLELHAGQIVGFDVAALLQRFIAALEVAVSDRLPAGQFIDPLLQVRELLAVLVLRAVLGLLDVLLRLVLFASLRFRLAPVPECAWPAHRPTAAASRPAARPPPRRRPRR